MEFRTVVDIPKPRFQIEPLQELLFVGSCFADNIGRRFEEEHFRVTINPFGTMYNPASVLHTLQKLFSPPLGRGRGWAFPPGAGSGLVFITLGTNHVYRLRETGEIVDNCEKRPQRLFTEEQLSVQDCVDYLASGIEVLQQRLPEDLQVVLTVSPIRYAKYGFHASLLSKATLLMAVDELLRLYPDCTTYFPAYEIVCDELRDYRFYQEDMLHPSSQAVEYIWERLVESYFSPDAKRFLREWQPIKKALHHKPFHPESEAYQRFLADAQRREKELIERYL